MVLSKYFSLFRLSSFLSKNILIFKCGCQSGSASLHLEIAFFKISRADKNFKIFCPSVLTIVALFVTLKHVKQIFFTQFFTMQL